ncbi:hypothetical protein JHK82_035492 [Glycine max]|nr:hypothetical protein JHK87_035418 [Glycine soja]KAG4969788.1 hypothetical protein JHK85_036209 [Glycine max]KAG4976145.1 hypothetical protein JHK86_035619 [Glycine max]KAG5112223.1 hypothetical protein JHK82_035492 [Glycine max]KAG5129502.1 hypothetical protein JHK84_035899 [Glycine max]
MDKHIEMSYCGYEAFKVLAKNYLDKLLGKINMTPADVAENLMPKSFVEDSETCLKNLVKSLEEAKKKVKEQEVNANGKSGEGLKENGTVH